MSYAEAFWPPVAVCFTLATTIIVIAELSFLSLRFLSKLSPENSRLHQLRPYALWLLPLPFHQLWLYETDNPDDYFDSYPEDL